jgi:uncharacterized protein YidB (DUF937 family)
MVGVERKRRMEWGSLTPIVTCRCAPAPALRIASLSGKANNQSVVNPYKEYEMGLLDGIAGQVLGSLLGGGNQGGQGGAGAGQLIQVVMNMLQNQQGGLGGLLQQFQNAGLGDQAASWVGTGQNMPINADQVTSALGSGTLSDIASQLGMSQGQASGALAGILPQLIDQLTPHGQVTEQHNSLDGLAALAGKLLR